MKSLFSRIQSHVNWKDTKPAENMFTSVMTAVLEYVPKFKLMLIEKILKRVVLKGYRISIQEKLSIGIIPDIMLVSEDGKTEILIENKLESSLDVSQVKNYIKYINKNKTVAVKLVVISYYGEDVLLEKKYKKMNIRSLKWVEIYRMAHRCLEYETNRDKRFLLSEFQKYMEGKGMADFKGLNRRDLNTNSISKVILLFTYSVNEATKKNKIKRVKKFGAFGDAECNSGIYTGFKINNVDVFFYLDFSYKDVCFGVECKWSGKVITNNINQKKAYIYACIRRKYSKFKQMDEPKRNQLYFYSSLANLIGGNKDGEVQKKEFIRNIIGIIKILKKVL